MEKTKVTYMDVDSLIPYANNPRLNDNAVDAVAASIKEFGFKVPIVVDGENVIINGHTRLKAAHKLGMKQVPVIVADDLTPEQVKAFRLADNKTGELAQWDMAKLGIELEGIGEIDMGEFGFDIDFGGIDLSDMNIEGDDYEQELPAEPKSKTGEIYRLGRHRLMVGDSTSAADVDKLTDGAIIDLCVTDPPYNVAIGIENPEEAKKRHRRTDGLMIANDEMSDEDFYSFLKAFYTQMLRVLKEGGAYYVWHADSIGHVFRDALIDAGGQVKQVLIWVKNALVLGRQDYQWKHEPCIYGWKAGAGHYFINDRKQTTVFEDQLDLDKMTKEQMRKMLEEMLADTMPTTVIHEDKPTRSGMHPTMKPVRLMSILINNSSKPKENVIDFFGGSGSTLIACEQLDRTCYTMELDPRYADAIIYRWEQFTGEKAERIN